MENNMNTTTNEKLFDALLRVAADEALREEMDALPPDEELNKMYPRTKSLDKKVNAVIKREFRAIRMKRAILTFTKIAAGISLFTVLTGALLMSVEASRNFILNALIDIRGDYIAIDFSIGAMPTTEYTGIVLDYLPEGLELISSQSLRRMNTKIFASDTGDSLIVQQMAGEHLSINIDNEYMEFSERRLRMGTARIFETVDEYSYSVVMWEVGTDVFKVTGTFDIETLIKISENLRVN
ncbi:MAG: DUF4367 domain-containing protein [Defluviitaleaceae bacterium]|nr:DUF4367 domain-containing protein [Defluviitaleaceae bacterium]